MLDKFPTTLFREYSELEPTVAIMAAAEAMTEHLARALARADTFDETQYVHGSFGAIIEDVERQVQRLRGVADAAAQTVQLV
jgi:hypothetical protein